MQSNDLTEGLDLKISIPKCFRRQITPAKHGDDNNPYNRRPRYFHLPCMLTSTVALQGAFLEHINHLNVLRHLTSPAFLPIEVRTEADLRKCDALIIPGGESTTIALVAEREGLLDPLREFVAYRPIM